MFPSGRMSAAKTRAFGKWTTAKLAPGSTRNNKAYRPDYHMEVIGADGVHVGTVDRVEENRIKLTKADSGEGRHKGHHHYIDGSLVADVEGNKVRLSANGDVAVTMEQEA